PKAASKGKAKGNAKSSGKTKAKPKGVQSKEHKPKPVPPKKAQPPHKRYTDKQLSLPTLNGIVPAGVQKRPRGKKGKVFVEDEKSLQAILAMVMAEKEGDLESKLKRQRQLEEVRRTKQEVMEQRKDQKQKEWE
ncbi:hypothetical protein K470DRAFT_200888, partial [Piedraia hortae CBS 480.64]